MKKTARKQKSIWENLFQFFLMIPVVFLFVIPMVQFSAGKAEAVAGINRTINFQGRVVNKTDGTNVTDGAYTFLFKIYDAASAGNLLWGGTGESQSLTVTNGIFQAALGSVRSFATDNLDFNQDNLWLDITFNGENFGSRVRLAGVPYAFTAEKVAGLTVTNNGGNTLNIAANKTLTASDTTTIATNAITLGGGEVITFTAANAVTFTTTGTTSVTLPTSGTLLSTTGGQTISGTLTLSTNSSTGLTVGANGSVNPVLQIDSSAVSVATGLKIAGAATGGITALTVIDSGPNANLSINAKGSGTVSINNTATGGITLGALTTLAAGKALVITGGAGDPTATAGTVWYDSTAGKFKIVEGSTVKILCNTTDAGCGTGGSTSLQTAYNTGNTINLANNDLIIGNTFTGIGGLVVNPNAGGDAALIVDKQALSGDIFTASASGNTKFVLKNDGTLIVGGATPASATFAVSSPSGGTPTATVSGDLVINNRPTTVVSDMQKWTKLTGTAGTIGGGTANVASISASVVYNGSLYVGTTNANAAEIYRYDGDGAGTWTKVSGTAGTVGGGATTNIDQISSLTVYNGYLYAGTTETDKAEIYRYNGGTSWSQLNVTGTAGKFLTTTLIDGVNSMAVFGGRLFIGTREAAQAQLYMYNGGTTWIAVNGTAGTFIATNTIAVDAVTQMVVINNQLVLGLLKTGDADVVRWNGIVGGSPFFALNAATTTGSYLIDNAAQTGYNEVTSMSVWAGKLVVGLRRGAAQADILMYQEPPSGAVPVNSWTRLNSAAGTIGTASIDMVSALAIYEGRLYAGTNKANAGEIYRYDEGKSWTKVSQAAAGQIANAGTTNIDGIATLIQYNSNLFAGTWEGTTGEGYTYSVFIDQSYALKFNANASQGGGVQNGNQNQAQIYFVASLSANLNNKQGNTGAFVFSHSIVTNNGSYDVAEDYPTRDDTLEPGDVVSIETNERGFVRKSNGAYDYAVMGIYSEKPALRLSQDDSTINGGHTIPIALAGRVPVKVNTENGPIVAGDYLTASSVNGIAMKAKKSGIVIGQAMEPYDSEGIGKVLTYIKSTTYQGSIASAFTGIDTTAVDSSNKILKSLATQKSGLSNSEMATDKLVAGLEIITPKVTADEIFARVIHADQIEGLEIFTNKLTLLDDKVNTLVQEATSSGNLIDPFATSSAVLGIATSSGSVTFADLTVDGLATVSGNLRVKGTGLFEGLLTVLDTLTTHNFIVTGVSDFFSTVIFHSNLTVSGKIQVGKDTAGVAIIPKGQSSVHIEFGASYGNTPIVTASLVVDEQKNSDGSVAQDVGQSVLSANYSYIVTQRSIHGFTILLNKPAADDLKFSWVALSTDNQSLVAPHVSGGITPIATSTPTIVNQSSVSATPQPSGSL